MGTMVYLPKPGMAGLADSTAFRAVWGQQHSFHSNVGGPAGSAQATALRNSQKRRRSMLMQTCTLARS